MHGETTQLLKVWGLSSLHPSHMLFSLTEMASLLPARVPCLTYAQIKHHLSYEDFIVVSLYPSLSQTLLP